MTIRFDEIQYSVKVVADNIALGWHKELMELEDWCKTHCSSKFHIHKSKPQERIFIFDAEEDAIAFKLTWA